MELEAAERQQLAAVYELLGHLWGREADRSLLQTLAEPTMKTAWEALGGYSPTEIDEALIEELAVDYCQLLVGPKNHVAPIQSVWEDQTLQSQAVSSMKKYLSLIHI